MMHDLLLLFINMLAISLVSFGGGAAALFYDFGVSRTNWITSNDLSAILAFGYATPGPAVFGIATFIGYKIAGMTGAIIGTFAIFVAPWLLAMLAAKYFGHLLKAKHAANFIKTVGLGAAGIVAYTAISLMPSHSLTNLSYLIITGLSFIVVTRWKVNPLYVLLASGLVSLFIK
jgi:chromate transporter